MVAAPKRIDGGMGLEILGISLKGELGSNKYQGEFWDPEEQEKALRESGFTVVRLTVPVEEKMIVFSPEVIAQLVELGS
jgi:hypothetical protein